MKLKYVDQSFQNDAVDAICNIFDGCEIKESLFTIDNSKNQNILAEIEEQYFLGHANKMSLSDETLLNNVQKIQSNNNIQMTKNLDDNNYSIEMETGTGKTYVYTKTILELNKRYGFTKFIIVVPSIAIKEGVNKSFESTNEHFKEKYDNVVYNWFTYDSNHLDRVRSFATSTNIEIMIINIGSFNKAFKENKKETTTNIIFRESEQLSGNRPIDLIASTKPIVIIDEPQSVDNTDKAKEAIRALNPLCQLRYSATHKDPHNLMYRLTPVDAYNDNLVKHIEVASVSQQEGTVTPYIKLLSVDYKNNTYSCKLEINQKDGKGNISKKKVTAKPGNDIWELSKEVDSYEDKGYSINNIDCTEGEEEIVFSNGESLRINESIGSVDVSAINRAQINKTIEMHLNKELHLAKKGIKVLSLFFIDEVSKYRNDDENDKGEYAKIFEEEYAKIIKNKRYSELLQNSKYNILENSEKVHDGYFSKDSNGRLKNSTEKGSSDDETTYNLIMKNKERLLSFDEPIRFIFSHSALKEGWDNPNVFQVCTLVDTRNEITKRQKIGRGLRLCVNQDGDRVLDTNVNILSVIANEAFDSFARNLQKELETDNFKFGIVEKVAFTGLSIWISDTESKELAQDDSVRLYEYLVSNEYISKGGKATPKFYQNVNDGTFNLPNEFDSYKPKIVEKIKSCSKEMDIKDATTKIPVKLVKCRIESPLFNSLWDKIKHKTTYRVNMDIEALIDKASKEINGMPKAKETGIDITVTKVDMKNTGIKSAGVNGASTTKVEYTTYPDLVRRLQDSTGLLRKTIIKIINKSERLKDFYINPEEFIKKTGEIINANKKSFMVDGIKYEKTDEEYEQSLIFNEEGLFGYKGRNVIELTGENCIFDHVIYDSDIERKFAEELDTNSRVQLFAKLPRTFTIDTPLGTYNPDWVLVIGEEEGDGQSVYFVVETKGTNRIEDLAPSQRDKVDCGEKHFKVVNTGISYKLAKDFDDIK